MLSLKDIDLDMLTSAMENADRDFQCWLDPSTGQIELSGAAVDGGLSSEELEERGALPVVRADPRRGYRDMEDFIATVEDEHVRATLIRALERPRPFRHFKDAVYNYPDVGRAWSDFHDQRMRHHAITWLLAEGLINQQEATEALAQDRPID
ncbi:hypothetical protein E4J89_02610 [Arthrobacter sp. CAU 1506]|uniref:UPF0158 family protein n=1 Tax=Arthrobacter sp. CAU 1506 TaxID=2560052 RepID=UPI0010ABA6F5|nr:UPF0158 family protein [Arthrobacter sp. CAU 1506]TJY72578.1 hypothetical protein E4J89_02610 [Arthrobacter sp. CAU 1506]